METLGKSLGLSFGKALGARYAGQLLGSQFKGKLRFVENQGTVTNLLFSAAKTASVGITAASCMGVLSANPFVNLGVNLTLGALDGLLDKPELTDSEKDALKTVKKELKKKVMEKTNFEDLVSKFIDYEKDQFLNDVMSKEFTHNHGTDDQKDEKTGNLAKHLECLINKEGGKVFSPENESKIANLATSINLVMNDVAKEKLEAVKKSLGKIAPKLSDEELAEKANNYINVLRSADGAGEKTVNKEYLQGDPAGKELLNGLDDNGKTKLLALHNEELKKVDAYKKAEEAGDAKKGTGTGTTETLEGTGANTPKS